MSHFNLEARHPKEGTIEIGPLALSDLIEARQPVTVGDVEFSLDTLKQIERVAAAQTGSNRNAGAYLGEDIATLGKEGIQVELKTTYLLPPGLLDDLMQELQQVGTPVKRGEKGLEVWGPHSDRAVEAARQMLAGRMSFQPNQITETIVLKIEKT
ncbi:MAG: hypothetical protein RLY61_280 [Candidatus Parcubacteria bacterium]